MRGKSIFLLSVLALLTVLAIAAIWTQIVPQYRARGEVRVRRVIPVLVFKTEDNGPIPFYESFVNTQVSIMRSPTVLQRVLDQQEVQKTQWYKNARRPLKQRLLGNPVASNMERLRDTLSVGPRRRTEITDVSFMDPSPEDAKIIVDAVLGQYTKYVGEKSDATKDELYRQLTGQYKGLENEIEVLENDAARLRKSLGTGLPEELVSGKRVHLDGLQGRLSELQQTIAIMEWELKQTTVDDSNGDPNSPLYTEEAISLERQLARTKLEEQLVLAELVKRQTEFGDVFASAQLLAKANNALSHKRELFEAVRQRLDQKNMERNISGSIEVLAGARTPSEPDNDRRAVFTAIALGLCLAVGSGIVLLQRTRTADEGKGQR